MRIPLCLAALTLATGAAPPPDMVKPGAWSETFTMRIVTLKGQPGPPQSTATAKVCRTAADLADPTSIIVSGADDQCDLKSFSMKDGKVEASGICDFGLGVPLDVVTTGTYSPTRYDLKGSMKGGAGETAVAAEMSVSAQHAGDCE